MIFRSAINWFFKMVKRIIVLIVAILLIVTVRPVAAQDSNNNPVYIVQPGDTLTVIAYRFGVSMQDLIDANQITDPALIDAGTQLVIPGLRDVSGVLTTQIVPLGETLTSLSRRYRFPVEHLTRLNRISSPTEIYAGASVILPQEGSEDGFEGITSVEEGKSFLEIAAGLNVNPWVLVENNALLSGAQALPGDTLYYDNPDASGDFTPVSDLITGMEINPLPVVQGGTTVIRIRAKQPIELTGSLNGKLLHFFPAGENEYVALQGIHAMAETGLTPFRLSGTAKDGSKFSFEQSVLLKPGYYGEDPPLSVDPTTIDKAITEPEDQTILAATAPFTEEKYWDGVFKQPVEDPACIKSWFGNRRSYNGSDYVYFHTGVDYGVCANLNILAPAPGRVVFAEHQTVRGNATIIDHGWGVYSGIWHQASIDVEVGDFVEAGQKIGEIGATGRVTGPHLHWEVWVGGVQVQPLDWLENEYP